MNIPITEPEDKKAYEDSITKLIAETFHFEVRERDCTCVHCGVRFSHHTTGRPINERMINHAYCWHGIGAK